MTPDEADFLGKRIINTFRGGPPLSEWREELQRLDAGTAGTAFARLRRNTDMVTIHRFIAEYNALDTDPLTVAQCGDCDGSGWVQADDLVMADERRYTQNRPCRCDHGRRVAQSSAWTKRGAA